MDARRNERLSESNRQQTQQFLFRPERSRLAVLGRNKVLSFERYSSMEDYRGYLITIAPSQGTWRCIVTPSRQDLPILWRYSLHYRAAANAIVDARRRVDEVLSSSVVNSPDPSSKAVAALLPESDTNAPPTNAARHPTNDKSAGDADSSAAATGTLHAQRNRRRHEVPKKR